MAAFTARVLYWLPRVLAALWPAAATVLILPAVLAWVVATAGWAIRYGGWYGRPRIKGRPA